MERSQLLGYLVDRIVRLERTHPIRVGIDGPDASGKTTLANELVAPLEAKGRPVIRASIDGFHNPAQIRHARGSVSPDGYYYDSFNYDSLVENLLAPLGPAGSLHHRVAVFDYRSDSALHTRSPVARKESILLFDGVFLLRPEIACHWDFTIFVAASFATTLARAEQRDAGLFGNVEEVKRRYRQRYIPGQQLYFAECEPRTRATVVVDNDNPWDPELLR
jgi:uridine kinase